MKFKYVGKLPLKNADLVLAGIFKKNDVLVEGTVFEIPDNNQTLISRIRLSGNYVEYQEPKKIGRPKKEEKKEEEKEEK